MHSLYIGDTLESTHECSYGDIKLVGGPNESEGRVETCGQDFHWGTICNTIFANREAMVVCRQLGFLASGSNLQLAMIILHITIRLRI